MSVTLPPAAKKRSIAFENSKEIDPYVAKWHLDSRLPNESMDDFVKRQVHKLALMHAQGSANSADQQANHEAIKAVMVANGIE